MNTEQLVQELAEKEKLLQVYAETIKELMDGPNPEELQLSRVHLRKRIARAESSIPLNLDELNSSVGIFFSEFEEFSPTAQRSILRLLAQFHDLVVKQFEIRNLHL